MSSQIASQTLPDLHFSWTRFSSFRSQRRIRRKDFQVSCLHWLGQVKMVPSKNNPVPVFMTNLKNLCLLPLRWILCGSSHLRRRRRHMFSQTFLGKTFGRSGPCNGAMCDTVIKFRLGWPWNPEFWCVTRKTGWSLWQIYHSLGPRRCRLFRQSLRSNFGSVARPLACPPSCDRETMAVNSAGRRTKKDKINVCSSDNICSFTFYLHTVRWI